MSNREVMQQALEVLINTTAPKNWEAIDALRAALADPVLNADHLSPTCSNTSGVERSHGIGGSDE